MPTSSRNRAHRCVETFDGFFRLEHVDNIEAVLALSGAMEEQAIEREIGLRMNSALAGEPAHDLFVPLLREASEPDAPP